MKFNGTEIYAAFGDQKRFPVAALKVGQKIRFLFKDESTKPDSRTTMISKGEYTITNVYPGVGGWTVYAFVKNTKNAKYIHRYSQIAIDKAIKQGFIEIVE